MFDFDPVKNQFRITFRYEGIDRHYRLKQYHTGSDGSSYWHLFANKRILDLKYAAGKLSEELAPGQQPAPPEFLEMVSHEIIDIHSCK